MIFVDIRLKILEVTLNNNLKRKGQVMNIKALLE